MTTQEAPTAASREDLNLNHIVAMQFEKAAALLDIDEGLLAQIRACNNRV